MLQVPLPLLLAKGWKSVPPHASDRTLVWQQDRSLFCAGTDFTQPAELGPAGLADTPFALDFRRRKAYTYACSLKRQGRDYSELRAYCLQGAQAQRLFALGVNKWIPWFLYYLVERDVILALVATHLPGDRLIIQHQLGLFNPASGDSLLVALPRDAFLPLDVRPARGEILFHGVEGYQIIDFSGKRLRLLRGSGLPDGRGGTFHPAEDLVALGGRGIQVWDLASNHVRNIHPRGQQPVWSPDGRWLYFSESSGDLFRHQWGTSITERLIAAAGNTHAEIHFARKARPSADGRYLALPLSRRVKRRKIEGEIDTKRSEYAFFHALCILDLARREVWQHPGHCPCAAWLE